MSQWNLGVDVLPIQNNQQKLGDASHQFIVNGRQLGDASEKGVDSVINGNSQNVPTSAAVAGYVESLMGAIDGIADLDENGKIPSSLLPSYVDDVVEYSDWDHLPLEGSTGKIYVTLNDNKTYRWSGSAYVEISPSITLGTTSSTAYRGDYGNTAYGHATDAARLQTAKTEKLYKMSTTAEGHIASATEMGITDNTSAAAPNASDANLITNRTLANAVASQAEIEALAQGLPITPVDTEAWMESHPEIAAAVVNTTEDWLTEHVSSGDIVVDDTLSIQGAAADAKATGDAIIFERGTGTGSIKAKDFVNNDAQISNQASNSGAFAIGSGTVASGGFSVAEGGNSTASGHFSHVEGVNTTASGVYSHAQGWGGTASGLAAHAEGCNTTSSANYSHAEGNQTIASANYSHSEGNHSEATGAQSHSEGNYSKAKGKQSHAEGNNTVAFGLSSHAEGSYTIANGAGSHAGGYCNVEDSHNNWPEWAANTSYAVGDKVKVTTTVDNETTVTGYKCKTANNDAEFTSSNWTADARMNYAELIGNGITTTARSNARALDWDGNEYLMGDVYVGCNADSTGGTKLTPLPTNASIGQFVMWNGSAWVASSLPLYNGGVS